MKVLQFCTNITLLNRIINQKNIKSMKKILLLLLGAYLLCCSCGNRAGANEAAERKMASVACEKITVDTGAVEKALLPEEISESGLNAGVGAPVSDCVVAAQTDACKMRDMLIDALARLIEYSIAILIVFVIIKILENF